MRFTTSAKLTVVPRTKDRVVMSRLLRPGEQDDGSFDREFWRRAGTEAIFEAAAAMVADIARFRDRALQQLGAPLSDAFGRATRGRYGDVELGFLSVEDLIENKRRVGRPQDLLDIAKLEALNPAKPKAKKRGRPATSKTSSASKRPESR